MALVETDLFGTVDKVQTAIARLREFEPEDGYYLAFSGGKDSCVLKALADEAGVNYDAHYNMTTIDPPELVYFIREHHKDVKWHRPEQSFLQKVTTKGMPMRQARWCCEFLKESCGGGRTLLTGIRWAESHRRSKRRLFESCYRGNAKRYLHAIIDWAEEDIWQYIRAMKVPYCSLYDEGWKRIGCLFCPNAQPMEKARQAKRYPKFAAAFSRAFEKLKANRQAAGKTSCDKWADGKDMFDWWISNESCSKEDDGGLFDN